MKKNCSICPRDAAWTTIDKLGFMDPGTLCPSHYLSWKSRASADWFLFIILPIGASLMREYLDARVTRELEQDEAIIIEENEERRRKTMEQIRMEAILAAYEGNGNNAQAACRELKISKASFYRAMKKNNYKLEWNVRIKKG